MKIYVAGKVSDVENVNNVQKDLRRAGYTITMDWTKYDVRLNTSSDNIIERNKFRKECAVRDIDGVINADLVLVLMYDNEYAYRGTFTEIGCALGRKKKIIIVCPGNGDYHCQTNCFYHHPSIYHVNSIQEAYSLINKINFHKSFDYYCKLVLIVVAIFFIIYSPH